MNFTDFTFDVKITKKQRNLFLILLIQNSSINNVNSKNKLIIRNRSLLWYMNNLLLFSLSIKNKNYWNENPLLLNYSNILLNFLEKVNKKFSLSTEKEI